MARASRARLLSQSRTRTAKPAQRRVSRRKKGQQSSRKAVTLLAKAHQTVRRQRQDFHHKTALALVRAIRRDLSRRLAGPQHGAESPSGEVHSGRRVERVPRHPELQGCKRRERVIAVDPAFTSQTCSGCGVVVQKGLSVRWHSCPDCGTSLHRDHNAAKNIEMARAAPSGRRGGTRVGEPRTHGALAPAECQTVFSIEYQPIGLASAESSLVMARYGAVEIFRLL